MARILLVDDDPTLRRTLRAMLEKAGHSVIDAGDGDEAATTFAAHQPDLVLTDIIMPNGEGIELIGLLRRLAPNVPIIAMSGGGTKGGDMFLKLADQLGATQTLSKPMRQAELLEAVAACLKG